LGAFFHRPTLPPGFLWASLGKKLLLSLFLSARRLCTSLRGLAHGRTFSSIAVPFSASRGARCQAFPSFFLLLLAVDSACAQAHAFEKLTPLSVYWNLRFTGTPDTELIPLFSRRLRRIFPRYTSSLFLRDVNY